MHDAHKKENISRGPWRIWVLLCLLMWGCKQHRLSPEEGYLKVEGEKIWYRVTGAGDQTPIVMIHGGPGFPSYYLTPLTEELSKERPVIVFDQLGSGRSDRITDTALMSIEDHVDQLHRLLTHLQVKEFYLYGHSYGTIPAVEYYFKYPAGIQKLILASPCMSTQQWVTDADTLIASLDAPISTTLQMMKHGEQVDSVSASVALNKYFSSFYNLKMNAHIDSSIAGSGNNMYAYMWGQQEFICDGTLKNYDRTKDLQNIKIPVLLTAGEFDAARPNTVMRYRKMIPNAQFKLIKNAAHSTMNDNLALDAASITAFLR